MKRGAMPYLKTHLDLNRCPHCNVDTPRLETIQQIDTYDYQNIKHRVWRFYCCSRCGGVVTAAALKWDDATIEIYPAPLDVDTSIPERAREYLEQAINSLNSPAGAIMLSASSVDAMLKAKGYKDGNLNSRIDKAASDHLITDDMAKWAHQVRLDANDQRHADEEAPLPTSNDARLSIDFTIALGQFLFVLPARVQRGIQEATS